MNSLIKQLVNQKMNRMTPVELEKFGQKYGLNITNREASQVVRLIRAHPIDIFQNKERITLLKKIAKSTSPDLAKSIEALFRRFLRWAERQSQ